MTWDHKLAGIQPERFTRIVQMSRYVISHLPMAWAPAVRDRALMRLDFTTPSIPGARIIAGHIWATGRVRAARVRAARVRAARVRA